MPFTGCYLDMAYTSQYAAPEVPRKGEQVKVVEPVHRRAPQQGHACYQNNIDQQQEDLR